MKSTSLKHEPKTLSTPKKKKSLLELAMESTTPKELKILSKILAPYELRKNKINEVPS